MALNFEQSGKFDEAESLHNTMMKKFKQDKSVWLNACVFYVRNAKLDTARNVFQKALTVLDKRDRKFVSFFCFPRLALLPHHPSAFIRSALKDLCFVC